MNLGLNSVGGGLGHFTLGHSGLVGDFNNWYLVGIGPGDDVDDAVDQGDIFRFLGRIKWFISRIGNHLVDHTVTVKKNGRLCGDKIHKLSFKFGVVDDTVPEKGLETFSIRGDGFIGDDGNKDAGIGNLLGVATVTADNSQNSSSNFFGILEGGDDVGTNVLF